MSKFLTWILYIKFAIQKKNWLAFLFFLFFRNRNSFFSFFFSVFVVVVCHFFPFFFPFCWEEPFCEVLNLSCGRSRFGWGEVGGSWELYYPSGYNGVSNIRSVSFWQFLRQGLLISLLFHQQTYHDNAGHFNVHNVLQEGQCQNSDKTT